MRCGSATLVLTPCWKFFCFNIYLVANANFFVYFLKQLKTMTKYSFQLLSSLLSAMFVVWCGFGSARIQTALPRSWSVIYFMCKTLNLRPSPVCELLTFYNGPGTEPSDLQYGEGNKKNRPIFDPQRNGLNSHRRY